MPAPTISLDEIMSKRQFSVKSTEKGDALTKVYKAPASWNAEERSATFIMTAQVKDRYGDIVVAKGGKLDDFIANPVCLWAHNSRAYPIGMWSDIKAVNGSPKRLEGKANLAPAETTEEADRVAKLLASNMVRACSIGFMPIQWEAIDKDHPWDGYQFNEWELLECSICSVPANPAALVKAAGGDDSLALQAISLVLDEWARTPEGLIVPREQYEKAYNFVKRDANVMLHEVRAIEEKKIEPSIEQPGPAPNITINVNGGEPHEKLVGSIMASLVSLFGLTPKNVETPDPDTAPVKAGDPPLQEDKTLKQEIEDHENAADQDAVLRSQAEALLLLTDD